MTYLYRPLPYFQGQVLKCVGIIDETNRDWLRLDHPEGVELEGYRGDRIWADTHTRYTGQ